MRTLRLAAIVCPLAVGLALLAGPTPALEPAGPGPVRIGMLTSMFKDVKPAMFNALAKPFYSLVESQTGLKSELLLVPSADEMRQQLDAGKLQFGVFHGFEYAWMRVKQPALLPLMIAAPQHRPLRAYVVVNTSSTATGLADLKGKALALPKGTREHTRLFLARSCAALGQPPEAFFSQLAAAKTAEDALHDVADDDVPAAIVDGAGLQCFKERNPGRFKRLKVLVTSDVFPESVVVFREGGLDGDVIRRFRDGMAVAHATPLGRQLLSLWTMTGFEPIPPGYQQKLDAILRTYPPPDGTAK